jgi:hypothetical protein
MYPFVQKFSQELKTIMFSDERPCNPVEVHELQGGTESHHFKKVSQARDRQEADGTPLRNTSSNLLPNYTALHFRRHYTSVTATLPLVMPNTFGKVKGF